MVSVHCVVGLWQYAIELDPCLVLHTLTGVGSHQCHSATSIGGSAVTWTLP